MGDYVLGNGRFKATLLAGPIFVALSILFIFSSASESSADIGSHDVATALALVAISIPFGAVLAVLPILLLSRVLTWIAYKSFGLRHPAMWALAGGFIVAPWLPWGHTATISQGFSAAMTGTAIICALLCRSSIVWHD